VQSVGGILLEHVKSLRLHWDLGPGDRFLWFTTTGWMMWNFLIGGLLVGATVVLYDGSPGHPDLMTLWKLAERHRVTLFGMSAPFVTACEKAGLTPAAELDLTSVGAIGSTGSPLSTSGFRWLRDHVGSDIQIASFSGGTDVCTGIVGGAPTVPVWMGEISCRALGAKVESFSPEGTSLVNEVGELVITAPMPSMPVFFWGDDGTRLHDSYFADYPGVWRHGDWIRISSRGSCVIEGRSDATLNRGGVRMGTAEFYRVVESVPDVVDSLVVDTSSASGEGDLLLFVVLDPAADTAAVSKALRTLIRTELSPRHVPGVIAPVPAIPRTLNGKKCEVPVKRILGGTAIEHAVSRDALADPAGFDEFIEVARDTLAAGGKA
jgi:acetoacetyl-CoA synthetase